MYRKRRRMFFELSPLEMKEDGREKNRADDKPYPDACKFTNFPRNDRNRVRFCLKQKTDKGLDEE